MTRMLRAEWTKLRTLPSTGWLLLAVVTVTALVGAVYADSVSISHCLPDTCLVDATQVSLNGVLFGQAVVAVFGLLAITNEYSTRMICTTLASNPRRLEVFLAKAGIVTATVFVAGALGVAGSLLAGRLLLPDGHPLPSLADQPMLRAAGGTVLYLGLIALLSLGIGTIVRSTAGAVTTILVVLYAVPFASMLVSDPRWAERLDRFAPTTAGQAIQATVGLEDLPIGPWAGLGVLAGYAGAAMLLGAILFRLRDA